MAIGEISYGGGWTPPVGYVWLTVDNVSPATYFENTTWELISQNRVLMGAGDGHEGGDTEEAGLPNITGITQIRTPNIGTDMFLWPDDVSSTSALYYLKTREWNGFHATLSFEQSQNAAQQDLLFNASRSSSIYGNSTTVQPPAYYVYIWRRAS